MKITKHFLLILAAVFIVAPVFTSCSDDDDNTVDEYNNWKSRNEAYFSSVRTEAKKAIAAAKSAYGKDWEEHCDWRTYLSYSVTPTATTNTSDDSIYVKVINAGNGSGCPIGSDSVRIFYYGRLIPSVSYKDGFMFDHSGQSTLVSKIFDRNTSVPAKFKVTDCTRGFATALQHMHIGDRWLIYMPCKLGYDGARKGVPEFSTLIFEVELVQYARAGVPFPVWR